MVGWKMNFLFGVQGVLAVSFTEGTFLLGGCAFIDTSLSPHMID